MIDMKIDRTVFCSKASGNGAPAEIASRTLDGIAFASCHARHIAGTAASVMAGSFSAVRRMISGNGAGARINGMPCSSSGSTRLENPYECAIEMTPRFGQSARKPIVATILSASAMSCSAVKATNRAVPAVADVDLK